MKITLKIILKVILLIVFISYSPLLHGISQTFIQLDLNFDIFNQNKNIKPIEINQFNIMNMVKKENIPKSETDSIPTDQNVIEVPQNLDNQKRIYIYSTHQKEAYKDQKDVYQASLYLKETLTKIGYLVIVEDRNFTKELNDLGYDYNQSYKVSRSAINDALIEYQGFDLIIDFHRDSIPRNTSYIEKNGKKYAKMMIVLGGLSSHFKKIYANASTLFDKTNDIQKGIMKNILVREAYYNQDISE
ncbi:MAG: stage II sporulation protein P, partial [Traorella sp.]